MPKQNILRVFLITIIILLIPAIGMQVSSGWNWGFFDFVFIGAILLATGFAYEFIAKKSKSHTHNIAIAIAVITPLLITWVSLAVGIIGDVDSPANLMYFVVIAIEILSIIVAGRTPKKMAMALFATAVAQAIVTMVAFLLIPDALPGSMQILTLNSFLVLAWTTSGLLFLKEA